MYSVFQEPLSSEDAILKRYLETRNDNLIDELPERADQRILCSALHAFYSKDYETAFSLLCDYPERTETILYKAHCNYALKNYFEALGDYLYVLRRYPKDSIRACVVLCLDRLNLHNEAYELSKRVNNETARAYAAIHEIVFNEKASNELKITSSALRCYSAYLRKNNALLEEELRGADDGCLVVLFLRSELAFYSRDVQKQEHLLSALTALSPNTSLTECAQLKKTLLRSEYEKAANCLRRTTGLYSQNVCELLFALQLQLNEGIQPLKTLEQRTTLRPELYAQYGYLVLREDPEKALSLFVKSAESSSSVDDGVRNNEGVALLLTKRKTEAENTFRSVYTCAAAKMNLWVLLATQGRVDELRSGLLKNVYQEFTDETSEGILATEQKALREFMQRNEGVSLDALRRTVSIGPATPFYVSYALCVLGRYEEAEPIARDALDEENAEALSWLLSAYISYKRKALKPSIKLFERGIELCNTDRQRAYGLAGLGAISLALTSHESSRADSGLRAALSRFEEALKLDLTSYSSALGVGICFARCKAYEQAALVLKRLAPIEYASLLIQTKREKEALELLRALPRSWRSMQFTIRCLYDLSIAERSNERAKEAFLLCTKSLDTLEKANSDEDSSFVEGLPLKKKYDAARLATVRNLLLLSYVYLKTSEGNEGEERAAVSRLLDRLHDYEDDPYYKRVKERIERGD